jgi:hypothetical protein
MALHIFKSSIDGLTGHTTMEVQVSEVGADGKETFGPRETIGISPDALFSGYHGEDLPTAESIQGAISKWLAEHHDQMLKRKRAHDLLAAHVYGLTNTKHFESESK